MTNVRDLLMVTTTCRTDSPSLIQVAFDDWALARLGGTTITVTAVTAAAATQYVKIRRFSPGARHPSDNRPRKVLALPSNLSDIPTPQSVAGMKPKLVLTCFYPAPFLVPFSKASFQHPVKLRSASATRIPYPSIAAHDVLFFLQTTQDHDLYGI